MGVVPGINGASGVDRRNRWQLQLYGVDGNRGSGSRQYLFREAPQKPSRVDSPDSRVMMLGNGQTMLYNSRLQNVRT